MRILVTRPLSDGEAIARRLKAMGHETLLAPLLTVRFLDGPLDLAGVQAVLVTSANGARALARRTASRDVAIFAVGPQSAEAARGEGFLRIRSAEGDAAALADAISGGWATPEGGVLLHAAAEESNDLLCEALAARGFKTRREILYRMDKASHLPPEAREAIRRGEVDAALFFSPNSAALFAECALRDWIDTDRLIGVCISANTAAALKGLRFAEVRIAAAPNQDALLACL